MGPDVLSEHAMPVRRTVVLLRRLAGALLVVAAAAGRCASADAAASVEIPLQGGKAITGVVESADATEVVLRVGQDERRRIPWAQLAPRGVLRVRAALTNADDGPGRLVLAELASDLGLWADARAEYEKALALGALDAKAYARAVGEAEQRAVESGIAKAERAAEEGDVGTALELLRGLKIDFAAAVDAKRVEALLAALEAKIRARDAEQKKAQDELDRIALDADRKKEILARMMSAKRSIALADRSADDARSHVPNGNVTKVRKLAEEADGAYRGARRELGRLRRILRKDEPDREKALALLSELDRAEYRLLFDAAKFFWDQRIYARAEEFAARASYIDPVDPALLELRTLIRENRIRYRASDITNARPVVR